MTAADAYRLGYRDGERASRRGEEGADLSPRGVRTRYPECADLVDEYLRGAQAAFAGETFEGPGTRRPVTEGPLFAGIGFGGTIEP